MPSLYSVKDQSLGEKYYSIISILKVRDFCAPLEISIPSQKPMDVAFWISRFRDSTMRTNRNGDRGSPCRSPRWSLKGAVGEPFIRIEDDADITHDWIHSLHCMGKFICSRDQSRNFHETLSKALWKSIFKRAARIFFRLQVSMSLPAVKAPSRIWRPSMKDYCNGPTR